MIGAENLRQAERIIMLNVVDNSGKIICCPWTISRKALDCADTAKKIR